MFRFVCAAALLVASPAMADMPPKKFSFMSQARRHQIDYHRIPYAKGAARSECKRLYEARYGVPFEDRPTYGCWFQDSDGTHTVIVYTYDTPQIAREQHRNFDPFMECNSRVHEEGHDLGWGSDHAGGILSSPVCDPSVDWNANRRAPVSIEASS